MGVRLLLMGNAPALLFAPPSSSPNSTELCIPWGLHWIGQLPSWPDPLLTKANLPLGVLLRYSWSPPPVPTAAVLTAHTCSISRYLANRISPRHSGLQIPILICFLLTWPVCLSEPSASSSKYISLLQYNLLWFSKSYYVFGSPPSKRHTQFHLFTSVLLPHWDLHVISPPPAGI